MVVQNGSIKIRKLEKKDNVLLEKWLSDPAVLEYYEGRDNPFDFDKVSEIFYSADDDEVKCMVEYDGVKIGYIQFYSLDDETKREYGYGDDNIFGTDQFIGEVDYWNKGIGTMLVTTMVNYLIHDKKADRVVMEPQVRNTRAIHCYEKCGFKKVKILPKRELHEGEYQDCWLMEYKR